MDELNREELRKKAQEERDKTIAKGKPLIERLSQDEIYLLDENNRRIRRICGQQKGHYPEGFVCLKRAGWGTLHRGEGKCRQHSGNTATKLGFWERYMLRNKGKLPNLRKAFKKVELLKEDLQKVDNEIELLHALLTELLAKLEIALKTGNQQNQLLLIKEVRGVERDIVWIKKNRFLIQEQAFLFDEKGMSFFVGQIFAVIQSNVDKPTFMRIVQDIHEKIVLQFGTEKASEVFTDTDQLEDQNHDLEGG